MQTFSPMQLIICKCKGNEWLLGKLGESQQLAKSLLSAGAMGSEQFDQAFYLAWTLGTGKKQIANRQEKLWRMRVFPTHPGLAGTVLVTGALALTLPRVSTGRS